MKYDSSIVGEKVINAAGKEGTIISVSSTASPSAVKIPSHSASCRTSSLPIGWQRRKGNSI